MKAPKKLYWLELTSGKLPYGKKGGGKFTSREAAEDRQTWLRDRYGIESALYETQEIDWRLAK